MHHDESLTVCEYGGICVVVCRGQLTQALLECERAGLAAVARSHPGNAGFLLVIEEGVKPPSEELRTAGATMVRNFASDLKRVACVIEASGFLGSLTRSVLSGMQRLTGRKANMTAFFPNVGEASRWLADELPFDSEVLDQLIAERRADPTPERHASARR